MRHLPRALLLCLAFSALGCFGCSSGPKLPAYVPPELPKDQVATLNGHGGTYVTTVDQAAVKGTGLTLANWGGNKVLLAPGKHRIVTKQTVSSGRSGAEMTTVFNHDFKAGREYKVGPSSLFDRQMNLHDLTTGEIIYAD